MPQRDLLPPWRNVIDNAILASEIEGAPRREARDRDRRMVPEFGLAGFEDQYPHHLFGGTRQRAALMRTFLFERELLLDEPFGALDALTRTVMQRWLLDAWERHRRTVLFITHDVDEALAMQPNLGRGRQQKLLSLCWQGLQPSVMAGLPEREHQPGL